MSADQCLGIIRCGPLDIAVPATHLQEVVTVSAPLTPLPDSAPFVMGTLLFHGAPVPAINLPALLNAEATDAQHSQQYVVIRTSQGRFAIPATAAQRVIQAKIEQFSQLASVGTSSAFPRTVTDNHTTYPVLDAEVLACKPGMRLAPADAGPQTDARASDNVARLVVEVGGTILAVDLPQVSNVMTCPTLIETGLQSDLLAGFLRYQGRQLGVLNLQTLLALARPDQAPGIVMVVRDGNREGAFLIDRVRSIEVQPADKLLPVVGSGLSRQEIFLGTLQSAATGSLLVLNIPALLNAPETQGCLARTADAASDQPAASSTAEGPRQFIIYRVGPKLLATPIGDFQVIVECDKNLKPHGNPGDLVTGMLNWQGRAVPVLDLRKLFGERAAPPDNERRIIVVRDGDAYRGFLVSAVVSLHTAAPQRHIWPTSPSPRAVLPPITQMLPFRQNGSNQNVAVLDLPAIRIEATTDQPMHNTTRRLSGRAA